MTNFFVGKSKQDYGRTTSDRMLMTSLVSLAALVLTYILGVAPLDLMAKTLGFCAITAAFLLAILRFHWLDAKPKSDGDFPERPTDASIDSGLLIMDEASEFFAGSLNTSDAFKLVSTVIRRIIPFETIVLLRLDEKRIGLQVVEVIGTNPNNEVRKMVCGQSLVDRCVSNRSVQFETDPATGRPRSVAIPLSRGVEVFGVVQLYFDSVCDSGTHGDGVFEAIGTRIAPLILSAMAFERSMTNALTDLTTELPNERAFYLVLENQVAETQRKPDLRPLTILAFDIKEFDEINQRFGHAAGDRVLNFVSLAVKDSLRQMDFLARSVGDEFLAILPTASKGISQDVIARVHTGLFGRKLKINETNSVEVELNIGWAVFGADGETPDALLSVARLRKDQSKTAGPPKVLWFPQELVS